MKFLKILLCVAMLLAVAILSISLYSRIQLPYENGRFFDPQTGVVYNEQAIFVYGFLLVLCVILLIAGLYGLKGKKNKTDKNNSI